MAKGKGKKGGQMTTDKKPAGMKKPSGGTYPTVRGKAGKGKMKGR